MFTPKRVMSNGRFRHLSVLCTATLMAGPLAHGVAQPAPGQALKATVVAQILALQKEKKSRTPAQQKMDSQLVYAVKARRGQMPAGVPQLRTGVRAAADNSVLVDIVAKVTPALLKHIAQLGGRVVNSVAPYDAIRAWVPLDQTEALAGLAEVRFIQPAVQSATAVGATTTEGDVTHRANTARNKFGVTGAGVKVGVLSDSIDHLAASQSSNDLGPVTVLPGQSGTGNGEGTAELEIIHDMAPGAGLFFATGTKSPAQMAQNIRDLAAAGCNVIEDDVIWFSESPFQDGPIAQAVNDVVAAGTVYVSAADNAGNKNDGTSGTWEGDFVKGGDLTVGSDNLGEWHDFGSGTMTNEVTPDGEIIRADLFWADPLGHSANDYDLYITDASGTSIVAGSTNPQTGFQDPNERIESVDPGSNIIIVKFSGAARFLHLDTGRANLSVSTAGKTRGHAAARSAISVGASDIHNSYPGPFTGGLTNPVETFSADGPRRLFFEPDGTPITPGNFSATGGIVVQKPDVTAADGVATTVPGFNPFYGTSASAPAAAAIAALVKAHNPALTPAQVKTALISSALDIEAPGVDRDSGAGLVMADAALIAVSPNLSINDLTVTEGNSGTLNAVFTVTLSIASNQPVTVHYATADGTATNPADYASASGTLTFNPGQLSRPITVAIKGDTLDEANETFKVNLTSPVNAGLIDGLGIGTINDNDATPRFFIDDVTVTEGNSGTVAATFHLTLSAASARTVTVTYKTADGTAKAPGDYVALPSTTQTFTPGQTAKTIIVQVKGDTIDEGNETFKVVLQSATNGAIVDDKGVGTITDNDPLPSLKISDAPALNEGDAGTHNALFTVTLTGATARTVTVNYATANGTATAGSDYTATSGTLTFTPGGPTSKTLPIQVKGDTIEEPNETLKVNLSGATFATISDSQGLHTITNDDTSP